MLSFHNFAKTPKNGVLLTLFITSQTSVATLVCDGMTEFILTCKLNLKEYSTYSVNST